MTILVIIISYLLIGALIGLKDSEIVEDVIQDSFDGDIDSTWVRKIALIICTFLIIVTAPIIELYLLIGKRFGR